MAGVNGRLTFGDPRGVAEVASQIRAQAILEAAKETVKRVQERVDHPAADALEARSVNQWSADITGPRGGPGPIVPVNAQVLAFEVAGSMVFARKVQGVGLGPLIAAEAERVESIDTSGIRVK